MKYPDIFIIKYNISMFIVLWHWLMVTWQAGKQIKHIYFSKCFILIDFILRLLILI